MNGKAVVWPFGNLFEAIVCAEIEHLISDSTSIKSCNNFDNFTMVLPSAHFNRIFVQIHSFYRPDTGM